MNFATSLDRTNAGMHRWGLAVLLTLCACGPDAPFALRTSVGTYDDGSGRLGLALLATVRDSGGAGPGVDLAGSILVSGEVAANGFSYPAGARAASWWWPSIPASEGSTFDVTFTSTGNPNLTSPLVVSATGLLTPPIPELSADGTAIVLALIARAAAYQCVVRSGGFVQLDVTGADPSCDVSALPAGSYSAEVLALTADPRAIADVAGQHPVLPDVFEVATRAFGFVRGDATSSTVQVHAAGGAIRYGSALPGLAFHLSIEDPENRTWALEVFGPGIPASSPLRATYPAGQVQQITWTYEVPATQGSYSLMATTGTSSISTQFVVGTPPALTLPGDVAIQNPLSGGCGVTWSAVAGAAAYYASVWAHDSGTFAAGQWVTTTSAHFAPGTFTAGVAYDVYVAAADVDPTGSPAARPNQVSVSENTYLPVGFTAQ
jgi:hypothetical protein